MHINKLHIDEFKEAVGKFPTGVTVITTKYDDKFWGFTANSFASVSLVPPLISFCLAIGSGSLNAFCNSDFFIINILSNQQSDLSKHFAKKGINDKFSNIKYKLSKDLKLPIIEGAISVIECKKYKKFECGDHFVFIGEVIQTQIDKTKSPLLYFARSYTGIS